MFLYLTSLRPGSAKFITESGQALYKSETSFKLAGWSTVLTKVVPNDAARTPDINPRETLTRGDGEGDDDEDAWVEEAEEVDMQDRYQYLGSIKWKVFSPSIFVFTGNKEITVKKFFTAGCGWRAKMWTAADGRKYKWKHVKWSSWLFLNDGNSDTPVAKYHRRRIYKKRNQPKLEILEGTGGEHILDQIVLTFIYFEIWRQRQE